MNKQVTYSWRGLNEPSLELLHLDRSADSVRAQSNVRVTGRDRYAVSYDWVLDPSWRTRTLHLRVRGSERGEIFIERVGEASWRVDGEEQNDLRGCQEIDLSITPFSNTLALLRFGKPPGGSGELTTLYVSFPSLSRSPSRQRYAQIGSNEFLYIDLGVYAGFRARLTVDADGIVRDYEGLFEAVAVDQ